MERIARNFTILGEHWRFTYTVIRLTIALPVTGAGGAFHASPL